MRAHQMHLTMDDARQAHNAYTQRVAEVLGRLESTRSDLSAWRFIVPDFEALEDAATVKAQEAEAARVRLTVREVEDAAALALPKDAAAPAAAVDFLQLGDVDAAAHVARAENAQQQEPAAPPLDARRRVSSLLPPVVHIARARTRMAAAQAAPWKEVPKEMARHNWKHCTISQLRCALQLIRGDQHNRSQLQKLFDAYAGGQGGKKDRIDKRGCKLFGAETGIVGEHLCDAIQLSLLFEKSASIDTFTVGRRGGGARGPAPGHVLKRKQFVAMIARLAIGCNSPAAVRVQDIDLVRTIATRIDIVLKKLSSTATVRAVQRRSGKDIKPFSRVCVSSIAVDERVPTVQKRGEGRRGGISR